MHSNGKPWPKILLLLSVATTGWAATPDSDIKAVFLFHFTQFVEWPQSAFPSKDAPFVIGILGPDPLEPALGAIVHGEAVGSHAIIVRQLKDQDEETGCQMLYVTEQGESLFDPRRIQGAPILTVGESDTFFKKGGVIEFYIDRRHVRLRVDLAHARSHFLVISAKLLRVADVTEGKTSALEFPGSLAEDGPLDLLPIRAGRTVLDVSRMEKILAYDR
jgi:hypothetical protein